MLPGLHDPSVEDTVLFQNAMNQQHSITSQKILIFKNAAGRNS